MAEFPALPLFTDALLGDTLHLSTRQFGAYMLMLIVAWRTHDCALPDDDEYLCKITRMDRRTWAADKAVVLAFWKKDDNQKWYQGRLKDERKYVEDQRNKNAASGRVSALKRKERHSTTVATTPQQEVNQPTPTPIPKKESPPIPPFGGNGEPEDKGFGFGFLEGQEADQSEGGLPIDPPEDKTPPEAPKEGGKGKKKPRVIPDFDKFWEVFPRDRRGGMEKAEIAYEKALTRAKKEEIYDGAVRYRDSSEVRRGYAKGAAAWLNDDRWTDEPCQQAATANRNTTYGDSLSNAANAVRNKLREEESLWQKAS